MQAAIMLNPMQDEEEKLSELLAFRLHQHLCGGGPELASLRRGRQGLWLGCNVSLKRHGCACLEPRQGEPRVLCRLRGSLRGVGRRGGGTGG